MKIKLTISYDGTAYCGWQIQTVGDSVQGRIEDAVFAVTGERVRVTGSGRTDAGVHAKGQVAHFNAECKTVKPENFFKALNAHLPFDIRVLKSEKVSDDFDACRKAKRKTYSYSAYISRVEKPLKERYAVRFDDNVDVEKMKEAARLFVGEHDFKCLCASGSEVKSTVRTIYSLDIDFNGEDVVITVCGNGFLYNMVRIMVGTLVKAGKGKISLEQIKNMIDSKERSLGGRTLAAKGLCLESVEY